MSAPGVYLLLIRLRRGLPVTLGRRTVALAPGWYVYCGSALGGLAGRLARHLRTSQVRHWHVDALLAAGQVADLQVCLTTDPAAECRLAAAVAAWTGAEPVPGFGCTDCRCATHLFRFAGRPGGALLAPAVLAQIDNIMSALRQYAPSPEWARRDAFQTLVACILSLRTQDPVTDTAAARLFAECATPAALAAAAPAAVARLIYPVGMYHTKARNLVALSRQLLERFGGRIPAEIDDLLTLPNVGRKTANLVRSFAYGLDAICVDTHVHRICNRWGLVRTATPDDTERELRNVLPRRYWIELNHLLVRHGQLVCRPARPKCAVCFLRPWCQYAALCAAQAVIAAIPGAPAHPAAPPGRSVP